MPAEGSRFAIARAHFLIHIIGEYLLSPFLLRVKDRHLSVYNYVVLQPLIWGCFKCFYYEKRINDIRGDLRVSF